MGKEVRVHCLSILDQKFQTDSKLLAQSKDALSKVLARQDLGFHQVPMRDELWQEISRVAGQIADDVVDMVVVGIGGSSLGPKALYEVFESPTQKRKIYFCDNVDRVEFDRTLARLRDLEKTIWVFTSKSGSTIETLVAADFAHQVYLENKKTLKAIVVTEKRKNPLFDWAQAKAFPILEIPQDVGGRFSVLTAVGMLPMAFLFAEKKSLQNIEQFRLGAKQALVDSENITQVTAQFLASFARQEWISFFWFYSSQYAYFGRWLQQLWAESLAKSQNRQGGAPPRVSTPMWALGSCDQHSLLQQVMEGDRDKFVIFTSVKQIESDICGLQETQFPAQQFFLKRSMGQLIKAQSIGTSQALNQQNVSTLRLQILDLSCQSFGYQMMFWQLVVATLGECLDINAFDQPGVELGKRLAREILQS